MKKHRSATFAILTASLWIVPVAAALAQSAGPTKADYVRALNEAIYPSWARFEHSPILPPDSTCAVRIAQMPGGDVVAVDILPDCAFSKEGQAAIVSAVQQAAPLPYHGFETLFEREVRMVFHSAPAVDYAAEAASEGRRQELAEKEAAEAKRRAAGTPAVIPYSYYFPCTERLQVAIYKIKFQSIASVMVTLKRSGKIDSVAGRNNEPLDKDIVKAFMAQPRCAPVPDDVAPGERTIQVGPVSTRNWDLDPPGVRGVCRDAKGNICDPDAGLK